MAIPINPACYRFPVIDEYVHISAPPDAETNWVTLCGRGNIYGLCEVIDSKDDPVTCPDCLMIVTYCRKINFSFNEPR